MCEFISAIKNKDNYFYLTKKDLKGKRFKEFKEYNKNWVEDIYGHGAIHFFYPEVKGGHWECTNFSNPDNFPKCIIEDIKKGNFKGMGICEDILNEKGKEEYDKIAQPAKEEYEKIQQSAWKEYRKIEQSAWEEYDKIEQLAWKEYDKIRQPAWKKYDKIRQLAWKEYDKIRQNAFWKIAVQKRYRKKIWK